MALVLLPSTVVASIDAMNFKMMPELESEHGNLFAAIAMVFRLLPYLLFEWKKWLWGVLNCSFDRSMLDRTRTLSQSLW